MTDKARNGVSHGTDAVHEGDKSGQVADDGQISANYEVSTVTQASARVHRMPRLSLLSSAICSEANLPLQAVCVMLAVCAALVQLHCVLQLSHSECHAALSSCCPPGSTRSTGDKACIAKDHHIKLCPLQGNNNATLTEIRQMAVAV